MATTRIMPLHVGKGRTESRAISDIIDYVANPKKTDDGRLITGYACDSRTVDAEFLLAKRQYIAATGRVRGADDVIAYHVRQSFRPGEITPEEAKNMNLKKPEEEKERKAERKRQPIEDYMELQTHLARYFDTKVDLKRNEKGRGKIVISFKSDSDLERIVELLDKVDKK
mgnify:CR=1 FL=1